MGALDKVAPITQITTLQRQTSLYLYRGILTVMAAQGGAARSGSTSYHNIRNRASQLERRDKHHSGLNFISDSVTSSGDSAAKLCKLANTVLGCVSPELHSPLIGENGSPVSGLEDLANSMNNFFISKIKCLMDGFSCEDVFLPSHPLSIECQL